MDIVTEELANLYLTIGAGGLCLVAVVGLLFYAIAKIHPAINKMNTDSELVKQVVQNNTDAIKEMTRSNDNMASALKLIDGSMSTLSQLMVSHDMKTDVIESLVVKIEDRTRKDD